MAHFGILSINKPSGCSSRRVVDQIERILRPAKVGHAGTLDPLATGVLVICVGQATRLITHVQRMPKTYHATFLLGHRSKTDDTEGELEILADAPIPTRDAIENTLPQFMGDIEQVPPAHSAIKIDGRRAYRLARAGKAPQLAPRVVQIHSLSVRCYDYPNLELDIECGSGTYVRALGRDLGAALGTAAVMSALERTAIGAFRVENALALSDVTPEFIEQHMQPALAAVANLPRFALTESQIIELHHGRPIDLATHSTEFDPTTEYAATDATGRLVALLHQKRLGEFWPITNFK